MSLSTIGAAAVIVIASMVHAPASQAKEGVFDAAEVCPEGPIIVKPEGPITIPTE